MANRSGHPFEHNAVTSITDAAVTLSRADSGKVYTIDVAECVVTLPAVDAAMAGVTYTFVTITLSAVTGLSLSPAAADQIRGKGITAADNKDYINSAATDAVGDLVTLVCDGGAGWLVTSERGTWAREA